MPVLGLAHYDAEKQRFEYLSPQEALERARQNPEAYGDPAIIAEALAERKGIQSDWTISELFSFGRLTLLRKLCGYYVSVDQAWFAIRGKAVHKFLEGVEFGADVMKETRLQVDVPHPDNPERSLSVSGQMDAYYADTRTLVDYKTVSNVPGAPYESHLLQVNGYARLLEAHGYPVERIYLVYLDFRRHRVVPAEIFPPEDMWNAIAQTAWFLQGCVERRLLPHREDWCNPVVERHFCPFYEFCRQNPSWLEVPEGAVFAEGRIWMPKAWEHELFVRKTRPAGRRAEWEEEV